MKLRSYSAMICGAGASEPALATVVVSKAKTASEAKDAKRVFTGPLNPFWPRPAPDGYTCVAFIRVPSPHRMPPNRGSRRPDDNASIIATLS